MLQELVKAKSMKEYYENRKVIQQLYVNDCLYGDLAGTLLGIREQLSCIESMSLEIQSFHIKIEINQDDKTKIANDVCKIIDRVGTAINNYIVNNIDQVTDEEIAAVIKKDISIGRQYFDINHVGNMIEINL